MEKKKKTDRGETRVGPQLQKAGGRGRERRNGGCTVKPNARHPPCVPNPLPPVPTPLGPLEPPERPLLVGLLLGGQLLVPVARMFLGHGAFPGGARRRGARLGGVLGAEAGGWLRMDLSQEASPGSIFLIVL